MTRSPSIDPLLEFLQKLGQDAREWQPVFPWFRGERDVDFSTLLPQLFRRKYDENNLLQSFRRRAHLLNLPVVPPREATDQWLFLARHCGLPTRLLDWSEGAAIALYFALTKVEEYEVARQQFQALGRPEAKAVVWMLNPMRLNRLALLFAHHVEGKPVNPDELQEPPGNYYGLTWFDPANGRINIAFENIACAWTLKQRGVKLPVAVEPTNIHPRMNAQHSYFTVHGHDERALHEILSDVLAQLEEKGARPYEVKDVLRRYELSVAPQEGIAALRTMGVADSTIMPDADSLAKELSRFMREPESPNADRSDR